MRRSRSFLLPLVMGLVLAVGIQLGLILDRAHPNLWLSWPRNSTLQEVLDYIGKKYVDSIDLTSLEHSSISMLVHQLDPYSSFIRSTDLKEVSEEMEGMFEGIGIEFFLVHDTIMVINVIAGGPAEKMGLIPGDQIITIDDTVYSGTGLNELRVIRKLRGPRGSQVTLGIKRWGQDSLLSVSIVRDQIPLTSVDAAYMIDGKTGYIRINRFSETTHREFRRAIQQLKGAGMVQLILDLRDNGGGLLKQATDLADEFIDQGKLMVYTEGRAHGRTDYRSHKRGEFEDGGLAILVDEGSASASEIVAGAVQDWDRGIIVGGRTFGKGLVQEQFNLHDGSALRLSVAHYYTPSGRSIQKSYDRFTKGSTSFKRSKEPSVDGQQDPQKFFTASGRIVYGGGGILPDVVVLPDTSWQQNPFLRQVFVLNLIPQFAYSYARRHQSEFARYPNAEEFVKRFEISEELYHQFVDYARVSIGNIQHQDVVAAFPLVRNRLKAYMARELFSSTEFFRVLNEADPVVQAARLALDSSAAKMGKQKTPASNPKPPA